AQFERDLDGRSQLTAFKEAYQQVAGQNWEFGREQALLESQNIATAYAAVTGTAAAEAVGILDKYRTDYKVSIEDFADKVKAYVDQRGPDFRLNFFVDEVGQYIANHVKLMTNLQTIAESLATKCRGRAWLIVTAQEDMTDIVGDMAQQPGADFTKIQARFANRMKLTSADVAEVIQKRLLKKNEAGIQQLTAVYQQQQNNFKTLFDFADGAQTYRNFRDRDHFIHTYPFIPYQFPLFQSAIRNLSLHNAFEGKHSSVGERSMLGVFQQVAIQIAGNEIGQLATFDLMFEGIRTALKTEIQQAVLTAEEHLNHPFAVQVLKTLFLVKYVKEFNATLRNLTVLMLDRFEADLPALRERLEEALNLLEQQTYIQRNGELYEFLTNEEKDVEQEIKNTEVETSVVIEELGKNVFDYVIKERKIRYDENNQFYLYTRKLDDRSLGREYELAIHVISPFYEHAGNDAILRAQSMGRDELLVILPPSDRLMRDLLLVQKTEKYIRQNISVAQQESIKRILTDKQYQNQERRQALRRQVEELLGQARLIVNGSDLEIGSTDPQTRLIRGFHDLLIRTYPSLRMLRGVTYTENDIGRCLKPETTLLGDDAATFSEAEQEMLAIVNGSSRSGLRTTVQKLVSQFERKPYGWYLAAIQCTLAKLIARGKIELRRDGSLLEEADLVRALGNTHGYNNLTLEPQIEFTAHQVRQLREFYADFFDGPTSANEAKTLGQATAAAFQALHQELTQLQQQEPRYPFWPALAEPLETLREIGRQPYTFYLTELRHRQEELFDMKEQVLDPLRRFMSGSFKTIYDEAGHFLQTQEPNLAYVPGDEAVQIRTIL
ncbi:MAG: BREX system P-loop protein BrxC, partial [Candidatus Promineifilaceae bacterium]